jgi:hypothetical protein
MKHLNSFRTPIVVAALLSLTALAMAQDAEKQKMIDIEKAFAAAPTPGPQAAAVAKKYLYDGPLVQLTGHGQVGTLPKARVVDFMTKPDPSDPDVKSVQTVADVHVEIYGDTALVSYKMTNKDVGHKDAALNTTDHYGCLDTFVKSNGEWSIVGGACTPDQPQPQAEWTAAKKALSQAPKDIQDAYH